MARMIKNTKKQFISFNIITEFKDGTTSSKTFKVGDVVENLRYVVGDKVEKVTGRISSIKISVKETSFVDLANPENYFSDDVALEAIVVDCSEHYESNVVVVPAREIVEDEGVTNVERMSSSFNIKVTMDMEYTDNTIVNQDIEIGDVLTNFVAMSGTPMTPDITGGFRVKAFVYRAVTPTYPMISGMYLKPLAGGNAIKVPFDNIISFTEADSTEVSNPSSLSDIATALSESESGEVYAQLGVDVTIPLRDDGRITTTMISEGQTLNLDLNGHDINTLCYALYVNGGTLNISDSTGEGVIRCGMADKTYPAIYVANGGTCNMESGTIDTTNVELEEGQSNWLYGISCFGDSTFNMYGGEIKTAAASAIATTNGQGGENGSNFIISGDAVLSTEDCAAVYLPDQRSVTIKDNAKVIGGIVARMGHITVQDNAVVESHSTKDNAEGLGMQITFSGVCKPESALLALTGVYNSVAGNEMEIIVKDNAKLIGKLDNTIEVAKIDTLYDQTVTIDIAKASNLRPNNIKVYEYDELKEIATAAGRNLAAKANNTDLTIKVANKTVYPAE